MAFLVAEDVANKNAVVLTTVASYRTRDCSKL